MNARKKVLFGIIGMSFVLLLVWGFFLISNRLTYIERTVLNDQEGQNIAVMDGHTVIEQEIRMPYELFWGIEVKTGTYGRNNNSFWEICIREKESGKKIYDWEYNASQVFDGENYFRSVKTPVKVKKGNIYTVSMCYPGGAWTERSSSGIHQSRASDRSSGSYHERCMRFRP